MKKTESETTYTKHVACITDMETRQNQDGNDKLRQFYKTSTAAMK